jgi:hypothetical protein
VVLHNIKILIDIIMGMFDNLYVNSNMLPVSEIEVEKLKNAEWQTKSLECIMTEIYITENGKLEVTEFDYETVPKEERPYPDDDGIKGVFGSIRRTNVRRISSNYNGEIIFYNSDYEFVALFDSGSLLTIKKV